MLGHESKQGSGIYVILHAAFALHSTHEKERAEDGIIIYNICIYIYIIIYIYAKPKALIGRA